jgi:two-component system cell cycle sensor histidine kinase/response regulator CckA
MIHEATRPRGAAAVSPAQDAGAAPVLMAAIDNVTESERAEGALARANERLALAQRSAGAGMWDWDMTSGQLAWSPELYQLFGLEVNTVATFDLWRAVLHPEDRQNAEALISDAIRDRVRLSSEYRAVLPTGEVRWIHALGDTVYGERGEARRMSGICLDITERKRVEEALRQSEKLLRSILDNMPDAYLRSDADGRLSMANSAAVSLFGYGSPQDLIGQTAESLYLFGADRQTMYAQLQETGHVADYVLQGRKKDGSTFWVSLSARLSRDEQGNVAGTEAFLRDITERKRVEAERAQIEAQLQQAQKMESVGRLAGGVAHDFNNMLGVILGHAELALNDLDPAQALYDDLMEIRTAAGRSADLTRQLLAFARKQTVAPRVLDLNETVGAMLAMLRRLIGEDIDVVWRPDKNPWSIRMDPSQVDQILANLCVNARDAIAGVGKVTIETENTTCDEARCANHPGSIPGEYVRLTVSDDGCGMNEETLSHLFEPFFTTKVVGKGTGLGLATVYGIVKQNHGFADVDSGPGRGTRFMIYLPRHVGGAGQAQTNLGAEPAGRRHDTILLVEDDRAVLKMTSKMLAGQGYSVLAARSPAEAIRLAAERAAEIHLLLTDVVMPGMNGRELAATLLSLYPRLKCLFMSGYTADVIADHGVLEQGVQFIQKPFSMDDLAAKIRDALDAPD